MTEAEELVDDDPLIPLPGDLEPQRPGRTHGEECEIAVQELRRAWALPQPDINELVARLQAITWPEYRLRHLLLNVRGAAANLMSDAEKGIGIGDYAEHLTFAWALRFKWQCGTGSGLAYPEEADLIWRVMARGASGDLAHALVAGHWRIIPEEKASRHIELVRELSADLRMAAVGIDEQADSP